MVDYVDRMSNCLNLLLKMVKNTKPKRNKIIPVSEQTKSTGVRLRYLNHHTLIVKVIVTAVPSIFYC